MDVKLRKISTVLVGAGNRGCVYCDFSLNEPDRLEVLAVVEPDLIRLNEACDKYGIPKERRFTNLNDFLNAKISCDIVVNATMDELHYETSMALIGAGYNMLLEKPVTPNAKQLLEIRDFAKEKGVLVFVCHVLRYTPFYKTIKTIIDSGEIGDVMAMELNEHVQVCHFLDSFIRGKWNSEAKCGSSFLLQKSCHDMDLICWLNNKSVPETVSSLGVRGRFNKENMPKDATEFCYNCPHVDTCIYSAIKVHIERDEFPFQTWANMGKHFSEVTKEEKYEYLKTHDYGRCAYNSGGDITDKQTVNVLFKNGSIASFTMVGGTAMADRNLHLVGTNGEIIGSITEGKIKVRTYNPKTFRHDERVVDINDLVVSNVKYGGHGGGDYAIMNEITAYLCGDRSSVSITSIEDSVNSHLVVFAAEKSRKEKVAVNINE